MNLHDIVIEWRGVTFTGSARTPYFVDEFDGWIGSPGAERVSESRSSGHGRVPAAGVQRERVVQAGGLILSSSAADRNILVDNLRQVMRANRSDDASTEPLTITLGGRTDTADAQLDLFKPLTDPRSWGSGGVPWRAQWYCPNPRVYGPWEFASAPLVLSSAGLAPPQTPPFTPPAKPLGGEVTVWNPGNCPEGSPAIFTLSGEQPGNVGVVNVTTGGTVRYDLALALTDTLRIETESGNAYYNGAYRPPTAFSSIASDLRLAPGANVIRALGVPGAGTPSLTVAYRPASW